MIVIFQAQNEKKKKNSFVCNDDVIKSLPRAKLNLQFERRKMGLVPFKVSSRSDI